MAVAQASPTSDPQALALAVQAVKALTAGTPVSDTTLSGNVTWILGSDYQTGTVTLAAKGTSDSRVDLELSGGTRSDVRNRNNGVPGGAWEKDGGAPTPYASHNCLTSASWFFPALSFLGQSKISNFVFKYIGQEQHGGVLTQHIRVFQLGQQDNGSMQRLSSTDVYLDPLTILPLAVASVVHPDTDMDTDIPTEVRFTNYQAVSGLLVPFHFQWMLNGVVAMDVTVTNAVFNTGLPDSLFTLP